MTLHLTEAELHDIWAKVCQRLLVAERTEEGVLLDTIECLVLAYGIRSMAEAITE